MSQLKKYQAVMLPTEKVSDLYIWYKKLEFSKSNQKVNCQHIYIASDEKPKPGDWYYYKDEEGEDHIFNYPLEGEDFTASKGKKIIATTDKSLGLPQLSDSFIQKYIEYYNDSPTGSMITDIMVEYEFDNEAHKENPGYHNHKLKINLKDNTITIRPIKNSYNKKEITEFIYELIKATGKEIKITMHFDKSYVEFDKISLDKWIKENL